MLILPHINYETSGIGKQPTIQFSGVNLQVINGSGSETILNGTGNLIVGYDPTPGTQTGSHNLLLGGLVFPIPATAIRSAAAMNICFEMPTLSKPKTGKEFGVTP